MFTTVENGLSWVDGFHPASDLDGLDIVVRALRHERLVARPVELVAITQAQCNAFLAGVHRHSGKVVGWKYGIGLRDAVSLVGVACVSRPVARCLQDGDTLELTRLCLLTGKVRNLATQLLGAAWRVARDLGHHRLITYTLEEEEATSLRAAGWSWSASCPPRRDRAGRPQPARVRWEIRT